MDFTRTFEVDRNKVERILIFLARRGYKLETSSPTYYRFKRGSGWAALYTFEREKMPYHSGHGLDGR